MRMRNLVLVLALSSGLPAGTHAAASGTVAKDEPPAPAPASVGVPAAASLPIARIAIEFAPTARKQIDEDERFNPEWLREAIIAELRSRQLLDLAHADTGRALVIRLEEFEVRAASNVVMFGRLASTGVLDGQARITGGNSEAREFPVRAEVAMQIARKGDDKNPLKLLYRGFAEQFVDALAGGASRQPQRR